MCNHLDFHLVLILFFVKSFFHFCHFIILDDKSVWNCSENNEAIINRRENFFCLVSGSLLKLFLQ